jgi:hypothetical protein
MNNHISCLLPLAQVSIEDLSWDDKELVLRILFAKMNGAQRAVDAAITNSQTRQRQSGGSRGSRALPDAPVFISEGAQMPAAEAAAAARFHQDNFEIRADGGGDDDDDQDLTGEFDDGDVGDAAGRRAHIDDEDELLQQAVDMAAMSSFETHYRSGSNINNRFAVDDDV